MRPSPRSRRRHGQYFAQVPAYRSRDCATCHAGADQHVATDAEQLPENPATLPPDRANAVCLSCHENNPAQAHWEGSPHEASGTRCASCHDVHGQLAGTPGRSTNLARTGAITQRCLGCHEGMRWALNARSTHPLRDGQMECTSCHNPHGTTAERLLKESAVNEVCYTCHQKARGPFLWEHAPVRENCLTCHRAHGSNYPSLLQARTTQLCQSCHQQGRHQTLAGLPQTVWVSNRACLNCHSQIHGSNHPSGPLFQR
jgi:DmsE family decaheme c-type cytochrome